MTNKGSKAGQPKRVSLACSEGYHRDKGTDLPQCSGDTWHATGDGGGWWVPCACKCHKAQEAK